MDRRNDSGEGDRQVGTPLLASAAGLAVLAVALGILEPRLLPVVAVPAIAAVVMARRLESGARLQIDQMDRLRQAELALAERKELEDDKDGWIAQVSHELRTPLTPIKGFLHTLQRRDDHLTPDDRQRIYEVMLREEQRLEDLVNGLLQATTLDQRGLVVVPEVVDWPTVVTEQTDLYRRNDPTRTITVSMDRRAAHVVADANLATGVLVNLLSNALKYSPEGSPITVTTARDGDRIVTTVSDEGPGITPADRERIFERFTRLGDPLTRPQHGVGLGLYIARRSLDEMGGEVWCDEHPGGGARFGFSLPDHRVTTPSDDAASPKALRA